MGCKGPGRDRGPLGQGPRSECGQHGSRWQRCAATQCIGVRATVDLTAIKGAIDKVQLGNLTALLAKIQPVVDAASYDGERSAKNYGFVDAGARKNMSSQSPP